MSPRSGEVHTAYIVMCHSNGQIQVQDCMPPAIWYKDNFPWSLNNGHWFVGGPIWLLGPRAYCTKPANCFTFKAGLFGQYQLHSTQYRGMLFGTLHVCLRAWFLALTHT
eukprot:GHUV01038999.1.p1 GENE.GHUV01038999.1~~GHUV01038999.1.p1  ORF type:complete len:109 (-),score=2.83 GHUV01038999.1:135-461(-)